MAWLGHPRRLTVVVITISTLGAGACSATSSSGNTGAGSPNARPRSGLSLPELDAVAGGFVSPGYQRGRETVAVSARDPSGVAYVQAQIDGIPKAVAGRCVSDVLACLGRDTHVDRELLSVNTASVADGAHTCTILARDGLGSTATRSWSCLIDNTRPTGSLRPSSGPTRAVSFSVADGGAGLDPAAFSAQYSQDGARTWAPMASGRYERSHGLYTALVPRSVARGRHLLVRLQEADIVGNQYTTSPAEITTASPAGGAAEQGGLNYRELVLHTPALQSFWPLDDPAGSTGARDLTGSTPGIYTFTPPTFGKRGPGIGAPTASTLFRGTPDYSLPRSTDHRLEIAGAGPASPPLTVELWLAPARGGDPSGHLVSKNALGSGYYLYLDDRRRLVFGTATGQRYARVISEPLTAARWHFVAGTISRGSVLTEYVDGRRVGSARAASFRPNTGNLALAADQAGGDDYTGLLADGAVYSRALSGHEIALRYQAGTGHNAPQPSSPTGRARKRVLFGYNDASAYIFNPALFTSGTVPNLIAGSGADIDRVPVGWYPKVRVKNPFFRKIYLADKARGVRVIWVITGYFSPMGGCRAPAGQECELERKNYHAYAQFAAALATTYPGSLIEVWNEESFPIEWWPSGPSGAPQYAKLLELVYATVKRASPRTTVAMGGIGIDPAASYLRWLYRLGAMRSSDAVNIHIYPWPPGSEDFSGPMGIVAKVRRVQHEFRDHKPIWITETGASTAGPTPRGGVPLDAVRQSDDLRHYYHLLGSVPGVRMVLIHTLIGKEPFDPNDGETGYPIVEIARGAGGAWHAVPQPAYCALSAARAGPLIC